WQDQGRHNQQPHLPATAARFGHQQWSGKVRRPDDDFRIGVTRDRQRQFGWRAEFRYQMGEQPRRPFAPERGHLRSLWLARRQWTVARVDLRVQRIEFAEIERLLLD